MLSGNITYHRKRMGYSQETLARQLNVVRQTVSKWEKGLSVPDADMLERMAEIFEVSTDVLLGGKVPEEGEKREDDVARQLAILNEHFARRERSRKIILRVVLGVILALVLFFILCIAAGIAYSSVTETTEVSHETEMRCRLNGEDYIYEVRYDDQYRIIEAGGDAWIADHVDTEGCDYAGELIARVEDYFILMGGQVEIKGYDPW